MNKVIIIGCGPAGMMAGITAAEQGNKVTILEKMNNPGKKLLISGKGRCNRTNNAQIQNLCIVLLIDLQIKISCSF